MTAILNEDWELSTDDPASRGGQPVLVNRTTGQAFGPRDKIKVYPSHHLEKAANAVARIAEKAKLNLDGETLVVRFVGSIPPR